MSNGNLFKINTRGHLYYLNNLNINSVITRSLHEWHTFLGHPNYAELKKLPSVTTNMKINKIKEPEFCDICITAKLHRDISTKPDDRGTKPFAKCHIDLNGPIVQDNILDAHYIFGAKCDYSHFLTVHIIKSKSDAAHALQLFLAKIKPFGQPHTIRTDSGGEFVSSDFEDILNKNSINHEFSEPYCPWQNGHIERAWSSLFNCTRALLYDSKVRNILWPFAVNYAAFLRNRTFQSRINCTPLQTATGKQPDMGNILLFGSKCYAYENIKTKLEPRATLGVFIGYEKTSRCKLIFDPETHNIKKSLIVKCVNSPYYVDKPNNEPLNVPNANISETDNIDDPINIETTPQVNNDDSNLPTNYNMRTRINISYAENYCEFNDENVILSKQNDPVAIYLKDEMNTYLNDFFLDDTHFQQCFNINTTTIFIPNTFKQAMNCKDKEKWALSMDREYKSLLENQTWDLVPIPLDKPIIGGRWVYTIKNDPCKYIDYKSRFTAQDYTQRMGLNFIETYAPTAKLPSVRVVSHISIQESLICHHVDVNSAYLNAEIDFEDIYIKQPAGYDLDPTKCCRLRKAIYGLKQAAHQWHSTIKDFMFSQNGSLCFYQKDKFFYFNHFIVG